MYPISCDSLVSGPFEFVGPAVNNRFALAWVCATSPTNASTQTPCWSSRPFRGTDPLGTLAR